jgi:hypothetical protein
MAGFEKIRVLGTFGFNRRQGVNFGQLNREKQKEEGG